DVRLSIPRHLLLRCRSDRSSDRQHAAREMVIRRSDARTGHGDRPTALLYGSGAGHCRAGAEGEVLVDIERGTAGYIDHARAAARSIQIDRAALHIDCSAIGECDGTGVRDLRGARADGLPESAGVVEQAAAAAAGLFDVLIVLRVETA